MHRSTSLVTLCFLAAACGERSRTVASPDYTLPVVADRMGPVDGKDNFNPKLVGSEEVRGLLIDRHADQR